MKTAKVGKMRRYRGIESVPQKTRVSESFGPSEKSRKRICWVRARGVGGGGGGYLKNFWVGMCRWVPGTLSLYQS